MSTHVVHPVIVIPGITATYLKDEYPFNGDTVWGLLTKDYERITPHPDDLRYEAIEPSRVLTSKLNSVAYRELVAELRHNLSPSADAPTPVYTFAYDWRLPLDRSVEGLRDFIEEVIARTRLMKHYNAAAKPAGQSRCSLNGRADCGRLHPALRCIEACRENREPGGSLQWLL